MNPQIVYGIAHIHGITLFSFRELYDVIPKMKGLEAWSSFIHSINISCLPIMGFPSGSAVKNLPTTQETQVQSLGQKDPLEKGMAIHFSILAWRIPWTEEPGGLQSVGLQRVGYN